MPGFHVVAGVLGAWLLADFVSGLVHWAEDRYLHDRFRWKWLMALARDNELHHTKPTAMLVNSGWVNMRFGAMLAWPLAFVLWQVGAPLAIWLAVFFLGFGNLVHRWSHMPRRRLPVWIRALQRTGLLISYEQHESHHRSMRRLVPKHEAGYRFCAMSSWLNPLLDVIRFWDGLEAALAILGVPSIQARAKSLTRQAPTNTSRTAPATGNQH